MLLIVSYQKMNADLYNSIYMWPKQLMTLINSCGDCSQNSSVNSLEIAWYL